jgi:hypothetical protein
VSKLSPTAWIRRLGLGVLLQLRRALARNEQPLGLIRRSHHLDTFGRNHVFKDLPEAMAWARHLIRPDAAA